jgi:hypothetical protein
MRKRLQCLETLTDRKNSVVGEEEYVGDDIPRLFKRNILFIKKYTHEFGNRECRMGLHIL